MSKFHINKHGVPAPCRAQAGNCPLGGDDSHFDSKEAAQEYVEAKNEKAHGLLPGMSNTKVNLETDVINSDTLIEDVKDLIDVNKSSKDYRVSAQVFSNMEEYYNEALENDSEPNIVSKMLGNKTTKEERAHKKTRDAYLKAERESGRRKATTSIKEFWLEQKRGNFKHREDFKVNGVQHALDILEDNDISYKFKNEKDGEEYKDGVYELKRKLTPSQRHVKMKDVSRIAQGVVNDLRNADDERHRETLKYYDYLGRR